MLALLAFFGVLIITATPVYQIPVRLAAARDRALGRTAPEDGVAGELEAPTTPMRTRRRGMLDDIDPEAGDPAYDSPVLEDREVKRRRDKARTKERGEDGTDAGIDLFADAPTETTPAVGLPAAEHP